MPLAAALLRLCAAADAATAAPLPRCCCCCRQQNFTHISCSCSKIMIFGREIFVCVCAVVMTNEKKKKHILFLLHRKFSLASKNNKILLFTVLPLFRKSKFVQNKDTYLPCMQDNLHTGRYIRAPLPSMYLLFVVMGHICITKLVIFLQLHWGVSP